ncbi:MaoC family dehydratase [Streptomyces sediminimaris]|uniref:MaoC family dehydratase n=1 Tax=Streptomyces sediminimaris TaxID=3383721 RepID=UPI00399B62AF
MSVVLSGSPALAPLLARGALLSPFKRPRPDAGFPRDRLVLPGLRIDLARLAAYERVCGFATGDDALPLTYPHVLGFPLAMRLMSGRGFPLPLLGLVHTSVEITRRRALAATGEYELAVHVGGLAPHRRGTEASVITEVRTGGEVVWESRSAYLARHRTARTAEPPGTDRRGTDLRGSDPRETEPRGTDSRGTDPHGTDPHGTDLRGTDPRETDPPGTEPRETEPPVAVPGPLPAVAEWHLGGDVGRRYGAASGDRNPIHLYPLTARLFGFPRAVAHGMWTAARCLAAHGAPERVRVRAEFRAPVLLPGTVTYAADGGRFELRGGERVHVSGVVEDLGPGGR